MAEMLKKWEKTELPVLNISDPIKNKPNKKIGAFCNRSRIHINKSICKIAIKDCPLTLFIEFSLKYPLVVLATLD